MDKAPEETIFPVESSVDQRELSLRSVGEESVMGAVLADQEDNPADSRFSAEEKSLISGSLVGGVG